jgi:hypothetical protein
MLLVSDSLWPKSPGALSRRLNEIVTNLREVSILVTHNKDPKTRLKIIEIRKMSSESLESSESSELRSSEQAFRIYTKAYPAQEI